MVIARQLGMQVFPLSMQDMDLERQMILTGQLTMGGTYKAKENYSTF